MRVRVIADIGAITLALISRVFHTKEMQTTHSLFKAPVNTFLAT